MSRKDPLAINEFHRAAFKTMLRVIADRNITSIEALNAVNGRKMLDEPLWQLIAANGKYGSPFISEGVKTLEDRLNRRVGLSSGTWPEPVLQQFLGQHPSKIPWSKDPSYRCQLDHVSERAKIIRMILADPQRCDEVLDTVLLGCVVLESEHRRLASASIDLDELWQRYRTAGIAVWSRTTEEWIVSPTRVS